MKKTLKLQIKTLETKATPAYYNGRWIPENTQTSQCCSDPIADPQFCEPPGTDDGDDGQCQVQPAGKVAAVAFF